MKKVCVEMKNISVVRLTISLLPVITALSMAQPVATSVRLLPLDASHQWAAPRFSPDGRRIYYTTVGYSGIWEYDRTTSKTRQISADPGAGYGFSLSGDGSSIAYRRTLTDSSNHRRRQDIVLQDLGNGSTRVIGSGADLSLPAFKGNNLLFVSTRGIEQSTVSSSRGTTIIGIEDTKISIVRDGVRGLLDPLGNGNYVWPSLSPDGSTILAVEVQRGAFLCSPDGNVLTHLGRLDAPVWTRDGQWIVSMQARDDGHRLLSSHIAVISTDGTASALLTDDAHRIDLDPNCSPSDNAIVFSTETGEIYLLEYREEAR